MACFLGIKFYLDPFENSLVLQGCIDFKHKQVMLSSGYPYLSNNCFIGLKLVSFLQLFQDLFNLYLLFANVTSYCPYFPDLVAVFNFITTCLTMFLCTFQALCLFRLAAEVESHAAGLCLEVLQHLTIALAGVDCRELFTLLVAFFGRGSEFQEDPFNYLDDAPKI